MSMPAVSLAEFSRLYLIASSAGRADNQTPPLRQLPNISQNGFAEHVFLAMAKPENDLTSYPALQGNLKKAAQLRPGAV